MAYPVAADFRTATQAAYCQGLSLTTGEAADAILTSTIARMADRIEILCDDEFVSSSKTYDLRGDGTGQLTLPLRCTAISTVKTRDYLGTLTTQSATAYRLHSSLDSAGASRISLDDYDYLEIVPYQYLQGLIGQPWWKWPIGPNTVQVVGTFGWTVTPADISRAIALLTYDAVKAQAANLRRATQLQTADAVYTYTPTDPLRPTGIDEADDIIRAYARSSGLMVG